VLVDRPQPHLDRPFDYEVTAAQDGDARPGVRVRVRFAGQDVDGWLVGRVAASDAGRELQRLRSVVSPEVVLAPAVLALADRVAHRWAGTTADVLRLAVPPRLARVEKEAWAFQEVAEPSPAAFKTPPPDHDAWSRHAGGAAFLRRVSAGERPRAAWQALPGTGGPGWTAQVVAAVLAARHGGRGALVVVPSGAEVSQVTGALDAAGLAPWRPGASGGWVRLVADDGPAARYRAFLAVARGLAPVVVGTRAAAFAPVRRLGVAVCWDDGDALHAEPRAPYPHARDVLALRSELEGSALLVGGYARTVAVQRWVEQGWARDLTVDRAVLRAATPRTAHLDRVELAREGPAASARLPGAAWRAIRDALADGPVLVQVPRAGYLPAVACATCRVPARCDVCHGPLAVGAAGAVPACRWCGALAGSWRCPRCEGTRLRSTGVGSDRTAEELGRAFPQVPVRRSGAATGVLASVPRAPALVVATPGAEPAAEGGYAAVVLLDAAFTAGLPGLDAPVRAIRTWWAAAALARPAAAGGRALLVGEATEATTGAFVRWDASGLASRELAEREELGLPPARHLVAVEGERTAVAGFLSGLSTPGEVLGPLPVGDAPEGVLDPEQGRPVRALLRTSWEGADAVVAELAATQATRSARREALVRIRVEPEEVT
jgi:primosomal protein N' (replication factor Y)